MAAEIAVRPLPVLVDQTAMREAGDADYPAVPMWRGLMDRGLLVRDIGAHRTGPDLQGRKVVQSLVVRGANRKSVSEITREIRAAPGRGCGWRGPVPDDDGVPDAAGCGAVRRVAGR